jgi:hypothetical protein
VFAGSELGITCPKGEQAALLHMYVGVYDEGAFDPVTTKAMSDQFNAVLDSVEGFVGLPVSAVSTVEDADPESPSTFVCSPSH